EDGEDREGHEPVVVEVAEREEQERTGERDRVELVQRQPLRRREDEVEEREAERRPLRAEVLPRQREDREGAGRDGDGLDDEQHVPEVEAAGLEGVVAQDGERREPARIRGGRDGDERAWGGQPPHSRSKSARQRAPRTASLARSW